MADNMNTAAAAPVASGTRQPTDKEAMFFLTILGAMKNKPEVDWNLVAERAGYTSANSAKTRFSQIKKALGWNEDGTITGTPTTPKPRAKKTPMKAKVGSGTNETPTKVTKRRTPKKKVKNAEVEGSAPGDAVEHNGAEVDMNDYASFESGLVELGYEVHEPEDFQ